MAPGADTGEVRTASVLTPCPPAETRQRGPWRGILTLVSIFVAIALTFSAPAGAAPNTYYVSNTGSDSNPGTVAAPFATISRAAATARRGDVVLVRSGRYPETVTITGSAAGVTFRGVGPTRPIVDGEASRAFGFQSPSADDVVIDDFEVTGQTVSGISVGGSRNVVTNNLVHDVGDEAVNASFGIRAAKATEAAVTGNTVHSIGPGGESMGIWLVQSRDSEVADNTIYLVRKDAIRDWQGLGNGIRSNRLFLSYSGVSLNTSTGSRVVNNYVYDNTLGIIVKHASSELVLDYWQLSQPKWSRVWHNTVWRSTAVSMAIGQSGEPLDYVDVRDNLYADAGFAYLRDMPSLRGDHVIVDGNGYAEGPGMRPAFIYKAGWDSEDGIADWERFRSNLGWETHGRRLAPALNDPADGDLDYAGSSPAAAGSLELEDELATQLGARGLTPAPVKWQPYPMKPIASSSASTWWSRTHLDDTVDDNQSSYWLSSGNADEYVTYDFGQERTFDHLVLTVWGHYDVRNIRGYRFEVSDDNENWETVLEGENPDSEGSSYKYALPSPATGRYLRFTMVDTFCGSYDPDENCGPYFVFSDLKAGSLTGESSPSPPAPEPPQPPPPTEPDPGQEGASTTTPPDSGTGDPTTVSISIPRQRLSRVIRSGSLAARLSCTRACEVASRLLAPTAAKRGGPGERASITIARGAYELPADRAEVVRLRLERPSRDLLAGAASVRVRLEATVRGEPAGGSTSSRSLTLRR